MKNTKTDSDTVGTGVRLTPRTLERIEKLIPMLTEHPQCAASGGLSKSSIIRLLVRRALPELEAEAAALEAAEDKKK